jgi:hypothetical protein
MRTTMSFSPYQKKSPGDVLKLQDWQTVQQRIKEELREHRHHDAGRDGDVDPTRIGPRITRGAFAPGAVTAGKLAPGSVGTVALAPGAIRGEHFHPDERLPEGYLTFRSSDGHDHDGVNSRALPAGVVSTAQLRDGEITVRHLDVVPEDVALSPEEESYARGRAFTPGNVLRASRELAAHTGMTQRPLLLPGAYQGHQDTPLLLRGLALTRLLDDDDGDLAGLFVHVELRVAGQVARAEAQILDEHQLLTIVPFLGEQAQTGQLRAVRGNGSEHRPFVPLTNIVPFTYQPAVPGTGAST